jgi:sulfatase maturation enzyme AslB (radical SAM superfamily)
MKFSELTFILTEDCNWRCSYCYQRRGKKVMDQNLAAEACAFFFPYLDQDSVIAFYGGEPLLAFDRIRQLVDGFRKRNRGQAKKFRFCLTTNGSLISEDVLSFLSENRFELLLSFDGLVQDQGRRKGTQKKIQSVLEKLLQYPRIKVGVNCVITPETVGRLSSSLMLIAETGAPDVLMSPSLTSKWDRPSLFRYGQELSRLRRWLVGFYNRTGKIPFDFFRADENGGVFVCSAGRDRLALAADGLLWGCYLFNDYFRSGKDPLQGAEFCFGRFEEFSKKNGSGYARILKNYAGLGMDCCSAGKTLCPLCPDFFQCQVCPMTVALSGGTIGRVPWFLCRSNRLLLREREIFQKAIHS